VTTCVLHQSCGHWVISDALHFAITMSLKLKEEVALPPSIENVMENYSRVSANWFSLLSYRNKTILWCMKKENLVICIC